MLVLLIPLEVSRSFMLPPGVGTAGGTFSALCGSVRSRDCQATENSSAPADPAPGPCGPRSATRPEGARIASVPEAQLEDFGSGLTPVTEGWFVVNVRDAEWWLSETRGARCPFENEYGDVPVEFAQLGINVTVLEPGQWSLYHAESNQEAFLVVSGECALLVENVERRLRPWDFFHAPPWTEHAFVGVDEGPCVILMVGSRTGPEVHYPVSELA